MNWVDWLFYGPVLLAMVSLLVASRRMTRGEPRIEKDMDPLHSYSDIRDLTDAEFAHFIQSLMDELDEDRKKIKEIPHQEHLWPW